MAQNRKSTRKPKTLDNQSNRQGTNYRVGKQSKSSATTTTTTDIAGKTIETLLRCDGLDYERILGVSRTASEREKKTALDSLAKILHPARHGPQEQVLRAEKAYEKAWTAFVELKNPDTSMPGYEPGEAMDMDELYYRGDESDEPGLSEDDQRKLHIQGLLRQIETRIDDSTTREAPRGIMKHYQDASDKIKELLADPENEEVFQQVLAYQINIQRQKKGFNLNVEYIREVARCIIACHERLLENPEDMLEKCRYTEALVTFECLRRYDGWPRDWNLRDSHEAVPVAFGAMADPYIHVLKSDPKNKEAKAKVRDLDVRLQTWFNSKEQMGPWDELIGFYDELASIMPDNQADHELHLHLEDFLETNHYPLSWAVRPPSSADRSRETNSEPGTNSDAAIGEAPPTEAAETIAVTAEPGTKADAAHYNVPTTRAGEVICGYKHTIRHFGDKAKWENKSGRQLTDDEWDALASHAYVFAILPNNRVPIGELRSASQIGYTARDEYLNWGGKKELRKAGRNDRVRWQGLEAVFVRPRGKNDEGHGGKKQRAPEIWAMPLLADRLKDGNLIKIEKPLLTRTEYRKLRNGTDADYDIVELFEKNGQEPPNEVRGSSRSTRTGFERPITRIPKQISNTREATKALSQSEVVNLLYIHEKQMKEMKEQMEKMEKMMNRTKERV